jgi:glycosyltransferase involved in cell wall biosynthesis
MSLTEALASRTPVMASDCPVFQRSFQDGEGVRLFKAQDPDDLANVVCDVFNHPERYAALSESTSAAFERVSARRSFSELLRDWEMMLEQSEPVLSLGHLNARGHSPSSA